MGQALHLDWIDYAERLLAGGQLDWGSPEAVSAMIARAQALLPSDLVVLPAERIVLQLAQPAVLAARPRGAGPLRALLADERVRAALTDTIRRIEGTPLAIGLPDPATFALRASALAGLAAPDIDEDLIDDAAVYMADFLRVLATEDIVAVVLIEQEDRSAYRAFYDPVRNVAARYGWKLAVLGVGSGWWDGLRSEAICADAHPETVLDRVRKLREDMAS